MFVGKDFLSRKPPPNYKPGIGRGAVGFSTTAERGGLNSSVAGFPAKRSSVKAGKIVDNPERFADADEEADAIYAAVDQRRHGKKRRQSIPSAASNPTEKQPVPLNVSNYNQNVLSQVSLDEWAHIPEAQDTTKSHKRLRDEEQQLRRWYIVKTNDKELDPENARAKDIDLRKRESLQLMVKKQPFNPVGYLQLAELEEQDLRILSARKIIARGCLKIPENEDLWLANIKLNSQSTDEITGQPSRELASQAIKVLPHSERLWLALITLEPTKARKVKHIHDALSQKGLTQSAKLWALAAEFETNPAMKIEVLKAALRFTNSASLWLELINQTSAHLDGSQLKETLATARMKCSENLDIWISSIKHDQSLIPEAVSVLPRAALLKHLETSSSSEVNSRLIAAVKPTLEEFRQLALNKSNWIYMNESEEICKALVKEYPQLLEQAIQVYPKSESIWNMFIRQSSPDALEAYFSSSNETVAPPPLACLRDLLKKLSNDSTIKVQWLEKYKDIDPWLWREHCQQTAATSEKRKLLEEGLEKWPDFAQLYVDKAMSVIDDKKAAEDWLRQHLKTVSDPAPIWLAIADLNSTSAVRKRAILTQATTAVPASVDLWLARIDLEAQEGRPVSHLVAEALERNPTSGQIWVKDLETTPVNRRKSRLAEALKGSNMSKEVLLYGAEFFRSLNMLEKARQWTDMADKKMNDS